MFGSKKKGAIEVAKLSSLIADNLHIVGDVHFSGGLRVDGRIEGNVYGKPGGKGLIVLSEKGCITGKVHAYDAVINGTISGDIDVEHFLELQSSANVTGNLRYRQLQMDCGATVDGKLHRVHEDEGKAPAEVVPVVAIGAPAEPSASGIAPVLRSAAGRVEPVASVAPPAPPAATRVAPGRSNGAAEPVATASDSGSKDRSVGGAR